jgi:hypothetical protein
MRGILTPPASSLNGDTPVGWAPTTRHSTDSAPLDKVEPKARPWDHVLFAALLVGTGLLYLVGLSESGWANQFYSAAAQAGSKSWTAFLFGSLDASNFITVACWNSYSVTTASAGSPGRTTTARWAVRPAVVGLAVAQLWGPARRPPPVGRSSRSSRPRCGGRACCSVARPGTRS